MEIPARTIGLFFVVLLTSLAGFAQASPQDLYVGTWKGDMTMGARSLPLEFVFERGEFQPKGFVVDPSGKRFPLPMVTALESGTVFTLNRGNGSSLIFTGTLGTDKASLAGEVTIMEGKVERGKIPWKAKKVVAAQSGPPITSGGPTPVQAANKRGLDLFAKKDYDGAVKAYSECLTLQPTHEYCRVGRALSFQRAGKYKEAIADFDVSIKSLSKPPGQAYLNRAEAKIGLEDYDGAIVDADLAFAADRTPDAHLTRGHALQRKAGLIHFNALMRGQDAKSKALEIVAKSLVEINTFIQLKPHDYRGYWQRGGYYYELWNIFSDDTRLKDGLADLDKAVSLASQTAGVYYSRYDIHKALGNAAAAAADYAKYTELSKK